MSKRKDDPNGTSRDTGDYSATKAPENRPHVESKIAAAPAQKPGGLFGTPSDVGMSALDRQTVPKLASEEIEQAKAQRVDDDGSDAGSTPPRRR